MTLRLLSSGVDSLYVSVNGGVRAALLAGLEAAKERARYEGEAVPFEFERSGWRMLLKAGGHEGYAYWLTSPEMELWMGRNPRMAGPPARVQFHSLYLHGRGAREALGAVLALLMADVCAGPPMLSVSRLDVYADAQGWRLEPADEARFVTRANDRRTNMVGRRFTGFVFGTRRGRMLARLYDKDAQMAKDGLTWMRAYWRDRDEGQQVWRLEFELRRELLKRLEAQEPAAVLELVPALWRRCTEEWLTLRSPSAHVEIAQWPLDPVWVEVQGMLGEVQEGRELVWQEAEAASELRVLRVLQGALSSWAAMHGIDDLDRAAAAAAGRVRRFLAGLDRTFASEVARKRARLEARGVRYDGLDRGGSLRLRYGGHGRQLPSDRRTGRRRPVGRPSNQRIPKGGESA